MGLREDLTEILIHFLQTYLSNPTLKELLFHLLAKLIRFNFANFNLTLTRDAEAALANFVAEMNLLLEAEKTSGLKMFSTYLQSLFELICAWLQVNPHAANENEFLRNADIAGPKAALVTV
jgi:hypothetical protein